MKSQPQTSKAMKLQTDETKKLPISGVEKSFKKVFPPQRLINKTQHMQLKIQWKNQPHKHLKR